MLLPSLHHPSNNLLDNNKEPLEYQRKIILLDGTTLEGILLEEDINIDGVVGFQMYVPTFKSLQGKNNPDRKYLLSLFPHLYSILDKTKDWNEGQRKESFDYIKLQLLPLIKGILDTTNLEFENTNDLNTRLEYMITL